MNNKLISSILLSFLYLSMLSAEEAPCPEGYERTLDQANMITVEALSCKDCPCLKKSFVKDPEKEYIEHQKKIGGILESKFEENVLPKFTTKMQVYEDLPASCTLDNVQKLSCVESSDDVIGVKIKGYFEKAMNQFLDQQDQVSCFDNSLIDRSIYLNNAQQDFLDIKSNGLSTSFDPNLRVFIEYPEMFKNVQNYQELKEQINKDPKLSKKLAEEIGSECTNFFEEMEKIFCHRVSSLKLSDDEHIKKVLGFKADQLEITKYKAISCYEDDCQNESVSPNCERLSRSASGVHLSNLLDTRKDYSAFTQDSTKLREYQSSQFADFCPLFACSSIEEAIQVAIEEKPFCEQKADPKRQISDVWKDLNCDDPQNADEFCEDDRFAELAGLLRNQKQVPRLAVTLPEGKNFDDLSENEVEQILSSNGLSSDQIRFIGKTGARQLFGLPPLRFSGKALSAEELRFREEGRESAEIVVASERAESRARIDEQRRANEQTSVTRRSSAKSKVKAVTATAERQVAAASKNQNTAASNRLNSNFPSLPTDSQVEKFVGNNNVNGNKRDRVSTSSTTNEIDNPMSDLKDEIARLQKEASLIKEGQERAKYQTKIRELENEVKNLRANPSGNNAKTANKQEPSRVAAVENPRQREEFGVGSIGPREQESIARQAPASVNTPEQTAEGAKAQSSVAQTGRSITSASGQSVSYLERATEELPFLTLEALDEVTPGENFVLGIRDGAKLATVEMSPETVGGVVFFRADFPEELSFEAKVSLLESPFFQNHLHPDSKAQVFDPEERARHANLLDLLKNQ